MFSCIAVLPNISNVTESGNEKKTKRQKDENIKNINLS